MRDILADKQGNIWFLSRYALNCYFPKTGKFRSYVIADKMPKGSALSQLVIAQGKFLSARRIMDCMYIVLIA